MSATSGGLVFEVFETHDPDVAAQVTAESFYSFRVAPSGSRHYLRIARATLGDYMPLARVTYRMRFSGVGEPLGVIPMGRVRSGRISYRLDGEETNYRAGDVFLAGQPDRELHAWVDEAEYDADVAFLDLHLVQQVAAGPRNAAPVRFTGYRAISSGAARLWHTTHSHVLASLDDPVSAQSPLVASALARTMAATALRVFPNTARFDPTIEDRHDAHRHTLRRAVAFIEAHPDRDITVADIAGACSVTVRAVQLAFRRHLDTTPMSYLRRVRLECAHRDLIAGHSSQDAVGTIAARWGFTNHSRFTALYRAEYGRPPSQTLRH